MWVLILAVQMLDVFWSLFVLLGIEKVRIVPGITAASPSALEVVVFFGGMYLYWRATRPVSRGGRYGMPIFGFIMLAVQGSAFVGPPPPSDQAVAITAFFSYLVFASVAYWLEKKRV